MNVGVIRKIGVLALLAVAFLVTRMDRAEAFFSSPYAQDGYSDKVLDVLSLAEEAEGAIDTNNRLLARWFLGFAGWAVEDALSSLPNAGVRKRLSKACAYINGEQMEKALRSVRRAVTELQELARFWDVGGAKAKSAELIELLERGDRAEALTCIREIDKLVMINPLQACLDAARNRLRKAKQKHEKKLEIEALENITEAKHSLRRAYLAARLTQVKMIVRYAEIKAREHSWLRARWAMWRGARKLKKGKYMTMEAEADALKQIASDIKDVRGMLSRGDSGSVNKLGLIIAKIDSTLRNIGS